VWRPHSVADSGPGRATRDAADLVPAIPRRPSGLGRFPPWPWMSLNFVPLTAGHLVRGHFASRDRYVRHLVPGDFGTYHLLSDNVASPTLSAAILRSTGQCPTISRTITDCWKTAPPWEPVSPTRQTQSGTFLEAAGIEVLEPDAVSARQSLRWRTSMNRNSRSYKTFDAIRVQRHYHRCKTQHD
jgi:hypothetical protein